MQRIVDDLWLSTFLLSETQPKTAVKPLFRPAQSQNTAQSNNPTPQRKAHQNSKNHT
nr:MAG TPA: hypothetical protein [Caudoviricetes sp.]